MGLFEQRCAALSWTPQGDCHGMLLSRQGKQLHIIAYWSHKASNSDDLATTLKAGYDSLKLREDDCLIMGSADPTAAAIAEITLPTMKEADLQQAAAMACEQHFPLANEGAIFSYRILSQEEKTCRIRLIAQRRSVWDEWLQAVSLLKVDLLAPLSAIVDSQVEAEEIVLNDCEDQGLQWRFSPDKELGLQLSCLDTNEDDQSNNLLTNSLCELGGLNELSEAEQALYCPALLLAAHGFSKTLKKDRRTLPKLPEKQDPKRHRLLKTLTVVSALYLIGFCLLTYSSYLGKKNKEVKRILAATAQLRAKTWKADNEKFSQLQIMQEEVKVFKKSSSTRFTQVLAEISQLLPKDFSLHTLRLSGDRVICRIMPKSTETPRDGIRHIFLSSQVFTDHIEINHQVKDFTLSLVLKPGEK